MKRKYFEKIEYLKSRHCRAMIMLLCFFFIFTISAPRALANIDIGAIMHLFNITEKSNISGSSVNLQYPQAVNVDQKTEEIYTASQQRISIFNRNGFLLRSFPINISGPEDKKKVEALAVDSQGILYILRFKEACLHRFNQRARYLGQLKIEKPDGWSNLDLKSIAIDKEDRIFFLDQLNHACLCTDTQGKLQYFFPIQAGKKKKQSKYDDKSRLADISISRKGNIIISDNGKREIHIYDQKGRLLNAFGGSFGGIVKFSQLTGVTIDDQDRIYAVDTLCHSISIFNEQGNFLYQFGGFGVGDGWFSFPSDIAVQGQRIFVTDTNNHRIQVLESASKELLATLDEKGRRICQNSFTIRNEGRRRYIPQMYDEGLVMGRGRK